MYGAGDATGRMSQYAESVGGSPLAEDKYQQWRGNRWRGVPAPAIGVNTAIVYDSTNKTLALFLDSPYESAADTGDRTVDASDILGYMGYPKESGLIQVSDVVNDASFTDATCDLTNTDATVTCDASTQIRVGMAVSGTGIPTNAVVASINTGSEGVDVTSFELSAAATATQANETLTFGTDTYGVRGATFSYTHRTTKSQISSGLHYFYGVEGATFTSTHAVEGYHIDTDDTGTFGSSSLNIRALISPVLNHTTLMTDELMAAVTEFAVNLADPNEIEGSIFDCRDMYAFDGRTFGEWGIAEDAIRVRAFNPENKIRPISEMFTASTHRDMGIQATHNEFGEYTTLFNPTDNEAGSSRSANTTGKWLVDTSNALSNTDIEKQTRFDCGFLPKTILQIRTKGRGHHANTPTPILVDSMNDPVDTERWRKNLKGVRFTNIPGDHILPKIDNPLVVLSHVDIASTNSPFQNTGYYVSIDTDYATNDGPSGAAEVHPHFGSFDNQTLAHFVKPATMKGGYIYDENGSSTDRWLGAEGGFGDRRTVYLGGNPLASAVVESANTMILAGLEEATVTQVEINGTEGHWTLFYQQKQFASANKQFKIKVRLGISF